MSFVDIKFLRETSQILNSYTIFINYNDTNYNDTNYNDTNYNDTNYNFNIINIFDVGSYISF